ncbi:MAG: metal ABC transporter permease [Firmicutes bacterium]|nr:metal ABC transporter permease [Bacillota bacterium]
MLDFLQYGFLQRALASAVVIGFTCSVMGVFVVIQGLSFVGAGIAHGAFAGVALGLLLGFDPLIGAAVAAVLMALFIGYTKRQGKLNADASIGISFSFALALAVLFIGLMPGFNADLMSYLFGNLLAVDTSELWFSLGLGGIVLAVIALFFKEFQFITFDPVLAEASGLPVHLLFDGLLVLVSLAIVLSLRAAGELLVMAFLVIPAAIAWQWSTSLAPMIILSGLIGTVSAVVGLVISFYFDVPTGSSIVLLLVALFFVSSLLSTRSWRVPIRRGREGEGKSEEQ